MNRAEDIYYRIEDEGESSIDKFIEERQSEELFLDFKRSADDGMGKRLHDNDRWNLAKAISGFGNSEGGVIVWGVDCSRSNQEGDVASAKVQIENPTRFVSWLQGAVSGCTIPPHGRVQHFAISSKQNPQKGYAVTLIPKSFEAPHQCLKPLQYYIRAGSDFVPTPHAVLSGMFGKTPQPFVFNMWDHAKAKIVSGRISKSAIEFSLGFTLSSWGPSIAKDLYVNLILTPPKGPSSGTVSFPDMNNWKKHQSYGIMFSVISIPEYRLTPNMIAHPIILNFHIEEPFDSDFYCKITYGHSSSPISIIEIRVPPEEMKKYVNEFIDNHDDENAYKIISKIMKIDERKANQTKAESQL